LIQEGKPAPAFALSSASGEKVQLVDFRGRPVVLYFYPKDDTPGCTKEACAFRDAERRLSTSGAAVLGVSPDSREAHQRFQDKYKLNFTLLSDPDKSVATKYGAWGEKVMYGKKVTGMIRSTFVIDGQGVVRKVFPRVRVDGHADKVLEALAALG
jgi:peroxiredoxin Q/BCP